ncbi:MAG: DUF262 domain-containing HNH endonuclease family protein [Muribaculaceae bacterium]|nr:DUF262 domain-containing HNH endonuclease family protein [Muribaculaceae bacterium]
MANNNISVNKQTVIDLLKSGKEHRFLIPEYQRPYAWGFDEVTTLFDDIWEFSLERLTPDGAKTYFLGSIVSFENEQGEKEIIDGQQRITSLFLLLRAVYHKLETAEDKDKGILNYIDKIGPAIWLEDEVTGEVDKTQILLRSDVATDHGNEILRNILETGKADKNATDNYSRNFNKFIELYEQKAVNSTTMINFVIALLNYSILLPISADSQDTALTIFSTLNNRGLPLSDADIFKSVLYKQLSAQEKPVFAKKWRDLEEEASNYGESLQSLFNYHMFYLRAQEGDVKNTTPGVRKYYMEKKKNRLKVEILDELTDSLILWKVVRRHESISGEPWSDNVEILKVLDTLKDYNNEYWKYPTLIYYNQHKNNPNFEALFLKFLRKLCVMVLTRYLESPTINAIKSDILKLDAAIIGNPEPGFEAGFKTAAQADAPNPLIVTPPRTMVRMLLDVISYANPKQTILLPDRWEIEHIFPQKWDNSFFNLSMTDEEVKILLEHLGNKLPLEKSLNIKASNGYFDKKKDQYKASKIEVTKDFGDSSRTNWLPSDIECRDKELSDQLTALFDKWVADYEPIASEPSKPVPTPEQEEMLRKLREAGLIP